MFGQIQSDRLTEKEQSELLRLLEEEQENTLVMIQRIGKTKNHFKGQGGVLETWNRRQANSMSEQLLAMIAL